MYFVLQTPSLQHLAAVKIVAHLWNQPDILTRIARSFNGRLVDTLGEDVREWKAIENQVKSKISAKLQLPELCQKQVLTFVKPLGMEIIHWCRHHKEERNNRKFLCIFLANQLCWTMRGTVDYAKTAELMVKDERVYIKRRFELACVYCFEDEARELFQRMVLKQRNEYLLNVIVKKPRREHAYNNLRIFLTRAILYTGGDQFLSKLLPDEPSVNKRLFKESVYNGNRVMCENFFNALSPEEREQVLEDRRVQLRICYRSRASCLLYYLSRMNEEQQELLFEGCTRELLVSLLNWPLQSLFMNAAECGWEFMGQPECALALKAIVRKINEDFRDYDYSQLFFECWRLTPADYKRNFLSNDEYLEMLLLTEREEFIKLVLNEASSAQMESFFNELSRVLLDESVICDTALMKCKQTALLRSSNDKADAEKRLRGEYVSRLVNEAMKSRLKSRDYLIYKYYLNYNQ